MFLIPFSAHAKTIKIAVIDTGYSSFVAKESIPFCDGLHANIPLGKFGLKEPPKDEHKYRHGTNIAWTIYNNVELKNQKNYCLVIINYFSKTQETLVTHTNTAIKYAINIGADYINFSGGGINADPIETQLVKIALDKGILFFASAGNEGKNLSEQGFFPALADPRVFVVGNIYKKNKKHFTSNFGKQVDIWENGTNINGGGIVLTGTSQAAAVALGKNLNSMINSLTHHKGDR